MKNKTKKVLSLFLSLMLVVSFFANFKLISSAASYDPQVVVSLCNSKVGTSYQSGYCLRFVREMFQAAYGFRSSACCAHKYGSSYVDSTSRNNIPLGASVFFAGSKKTCGTCGNKCGHIGIYVGNDSIVHVWGGKVVKYNIGQVTNAGYTYRGWGWHGNVALEVVYAETQYTSTNPDDYTYPDRTLKETKPVMEGEDVAWVQAVLKKLGYNITIDGKYGPNTASIVKQFQSAYGLAVDGYCGPKTREKLLSLWNAMKYKESPINIGDDFFGVILNSALWKPIHLSPNTAVTLETEAGIANQLWYFDRQTDGSYVITSTLNGNALEMQNGNLNSGTQVVCKKYSGYNYQSWWIYRQGNGYVFVSKHYPENKLALTLCGNNSADGTKITTETRTNNPNQIWSVYSKDDVQLKATTLNVSVGNSATNTTFTWNNTYGESAYDLKIWKNKVWSGDAYHIAYSATSGYGIRLPAGTYQAYVDTLNHYECKMSNVVTFTVSEKTYNVTYNANGGSGAPSSQTKTYGKPLTLSSTKPIRSGYTFLGWSTSPIATNATYSAGGSYTSNSSVTLYAVWKLNSYTVYYNANGGYCKVDSEDIAYNSAYGTLPTATRSGYSFDGWYTRREGGTRVTASTIHTAQGNITLYAHWIQNLTAPVTPKLSAISNTASGVKITWGASETADNYVVYRKTYNIKTKAWGGWVRFADGVTSTSYTDTTAKSGVYYIYTVRAKNEAGLSGYDSSGLKIKFLATPKLTSIANNTGKVTVKWNKVSGATGYIVYRKTYNASTKTWGGWSRLATTKSSSYNDTKAKSGTYYRYTVRAYYGDYTSYFDTTGLKTKFLATPTLKSVSSAKSGVTVKWGKVAGAKGYDVYRKTYSGGKWTGWTKVATVNSGSKVSVTDKTAKKGVTYRYTVRAKSDSYRSYFNTKGLQVKDKY